jgi:hypothetical protein
LAETVPTSSSNGATATVSRAKAGEDPWRV